MSSAALRSSPPTPVTELSDESNANLSSLTTATSPSAASALSSPRDGTGPFPLLFSFNHPTHLISPRITNLTTTFTFPTIPHNRCKGIGFLVP
ncbi:hypothetical protein GYH30_023983 [Glycine max]|nr:hypothetical protein GYH30_023983 [Glycine max]